MKDVTSLPSFMPRKLRCVSSLPTEPKTPNQTKQQPKFQQEQHDSPLNGAFAVRRETRANRAEHYKCPKTRSSKPGSTLNAAVISPETGAHDSDLVFL